MVFQRLPTPQVSNLAVSLGETSTGHPQPPLPQLERFALLVHGAVPIVAPGLYTAKAVGGTACRRGRRLLRSSG